MVRLTRKTKFEYQASALGWLQFNFLLFYFFFHKGNSKKARVHLIALRYFYCICWYVNDSIEPNAFSYFTIPLWFQQINHLLSDFNKSITHPPTRQPQQHILLKGRCRYTNHQLTTTNFLGQVSNINVIRTECPSTFYYCQNYIYAKLRFGSINLEPLFNSISSF